MRSSRLGLFVLLFLAVASDTIAAQSVRFVREATFPSSQEFFGSAVSVVGDINGDGIDEVVGGAEAYSIGLPNRGLARILDGKTGAELFDVEGTAAQSRLGTVVSDVGDINADGKADVAIAAPRFSPNAGLTDAGRVYIYSGTGALIRTIDGPTANARYGSALANVGDQNGDGIPDLAIGAPQAAGTGSNAGRIEVRSGADGSLVFSVSGSSGQRLGAAIVSADVNGDGFLDVVGCSTHAAAHGAQTGRATAFAHSTGAVLGFIDGAAAGDQFGRALASMGDIDGDGRDDIAIASPFADTAGADAGTVVIKSFLANQTLATIQGSEAGENFGRSLGSGDIGGDGRRELIVGAPLASGPMGAQQGRVVIVAASGSTLSEIVGDRAGDEFGNACSFLPRGIAGPGLIVGAWKDDPSVVLYADCGSVTVYDFVRPELPVLGIHRSLDASTVGSATLIKDIDGDGWSDLVVGQYTISGAVPSPGGVRARSGKTGRVIWTIDGATNERLGSSVASIGDQNADGIDDIAAANGIAVRILSGVDGADLGVVTSTLGTGYFGSTIVRLDDLDGDGIHEFAVAETGISGTGTAGRIEIVHGGDFSISLTISNPAPSFGSGIVPIADRDGDGRRDLVVSHATVQVTGGYTHDQFVVSTQTGAVIATFNTGAVYAQPVGGVNGLSDLGDVDGDHVGDFAVEEPTGHRIISGQTLTPIFAASEGSTVAAAGDVDGDGRADYYRVSVQNVPFLDGIVELVSGATHQSLASRLVASAGFVLQPSRIDDDSDVDGDGIRDALLFNNISNSVGAYLYRPIQIVTLAGAARYGDEIDHPHALSLSRQSLSAPNGVLGFVVAENAPGFAPGLIGYAYRRERSVFSGVAVLLPSNLVETTLIGFGYDAVGQASFFVDLRQPALAGQTIFLQAYAVDGAAPAGFSSSNGLMLQFID